METARPRVLIAHELASYAEPLAILLAERRPCIDVRLVAPAEIAGAVADAPAAIVVTDRLTPDVEAHAAGWLLYYPDHRNVALVGCAGDGEPHRIDLPRFADVMAAIDGLLLRWFAAALLDCLPAPNVAEGT